MNAQSPSPMKQDIANTAIAVIGSQLSDIKDDVREIKTKLEHDYVSQDQFDPIKRLVYGTVAIVASALILGLGTILFRK